MLKVAFKSHSRVIQVKLAIVAGVGLMTGLGDTPSSSHQLQAWYQLLVHDVMQSADGVGGGGGGGRLRTLGTTHNHWHHFGWKISQLDKSHMLGLLATQPSFTPSTPTT